jgi:hypothetical protein
VKNRESTYMGRSKAGWPDEFWEKSAQTIAQCIYLSKLRYMYVLTYIFQSKNTNYLPISTIFNKLAKSKQLPNSRQFAQSGHLGRKSYFFVVIGWALTFCFAKNLSTWDHLSNNVQDLKHLVQDLKHLVQDLKHIVQDLKKTFIDICTPGLRDLEYVGR